MAHTFYVSLIQSAGMLLMTTLATAQRREFLNFDFEADRVGAAPKGWSIPQVCVEGGYRLEVIDSSAANGKQCAVLVGSGGGSRAIGNCMQGVDATLFRGKRVRFSAAVRCELAQEESQAQLWLRVDRPNGQMGFFDNMGDRPIRGVEWQRYEIVGDIADDAESIALGLMLIGGGTAMLDDVELEVTDKTVPTTGVGGHGSAGPGLLVAAFAAKGRAVRSVDATTLYFPLPLAYRDQTPLTFTLEVDPPETEYRIAIRKGLEPNHTLELTLEHVKEGAELALRYESVILVGPSSFEAVPSNVAFPKEWPTEAAPWLTATWCCDANDQRIRAIGEEIRASGSNVNGVIEAVLVRSQSLFQAASGRIRHLTAVEALDKQGSCTSCANLVAALLRSAGVPARVVAGYPMWSGPLQTHYIVEAFVPGYGWYPTESTMGVAPWPNFQQVNVSIVPIEHETEPLAGPRECAAGAVPYMTLTEYGDSWPIPLTGTLKPGCDHEGRLLRRLEAESAEWSSAQEWARDRWALWLASEPATSGGRVEFGLSSDALLATTLAELRQELE